MDLSGFVPVPGFPNYLINRSGDVYSVPRRRARGGLVAKSLSAGYCRVGLFSGSAKAKGCLVHRLVLEAFVGPAPTGHEAAHINGVRTDCRLENLCWATRKENHSHKVLHGTQPVGSRIYNHKITEDQAAAIHAGHAAGRLGSDMAAEIGVDRNQVYRVIYGQSWRHVCPEKQIVGDEARVAAHRAGRRRPYRCTCGRTVHSNGAASQHRAMHQRLADGHHYARAALAGPAEEER